MCAAIIILSWATRVDCPAFKCQL